MKMKKCNKVIHAMALLLAVVMFVPIIIGQTVITAQAKTLKLSDKKLELMPDEFYELKVENAGSKKVTWKSSDKKVISVTAKGKVHAVGNAGESCTITATIGKKTLKCQASIMDIREYGTYLIWNSNWTYTGYDINGKKVITMVNREDGLVTIKAKAIILAMGCRERSRGALNIPGFRPAGVYSAGTAQRLMNIEGKNVGKEVVILGSQ